MGISARPHQCQAELSCAKAKAKAKHEVPAQASMVMAG